MIVTGGIDVGTSAVKVALAVSGAGGGRARPGAQLLAIVSERIRRRDPAQVAELAWRQALERARLRAGDVAYVATTGEGEALSMATGHFYGMTTHARGALFLDPEVRGVIDAGALHARAIAIDPRAKVLGYRMTSQCASGTGQFLENIARYLGVTLDEIGPLSNTADAPEKVSGICAVLAETDVINMVSRGITVANILRGVHESMAGRFVKLARGLKLTGPIMITGGLGADVGLLACLRAAAAEQGLAVDLRACPEAVFAGAIGAALWGAYRHEKLAA